MNFTLVLCTRNCSYVLCWYELSCTHCGWKTMSRLMAGLN
jgi:hypothetical protein